MSAYILIFLSSYHYIVFDSLQTCETARHLIAVKHSKLSDGADAEKRRYKSNYDNTFCVKK